MSRPSNPAVWRMDEHQRVVTVGRFVGRWADVIVNGVRESSTDSDRVYTGEVLGYGSTNIGTGTAVVIVRTLDRGLVALSVATVRRLVDRGDARDLIQPPPDPSTPAPVDAGLVPIPFPDASSAAHQ